jgi:hypothetical protein
VEPVPADAAVPERGRQRQALRDLRHPPVEGGVEAGHLGHPGDPLGRRLQRGDLGREVQRRERHEGTELGEQAVVDQRRAIVVRAAMHDAVAHHVQRTVAGQSVQRVDERRVPLAADDLD